MLQQPISEFQLLLKALGYVRTHWWFFLLEVAGIYSVSLTHYFRTPPVYESHTSLLIDSSRRNIYQSVLMPSFVGNANSRKQNMAHLLTSQEVMERFRNTLHDFYNREGRPNYLRPYFPDGSPVPLSLFQNLIVLNWDKNSDIYNIRCDAGHPLAAHDICLTYLNTVQTYYPEIGQREAMLKRDFLARQIASLGRQIQDREQATIEFQKKNPDFIDFVMLELDDKGYQRLRGELHILQAKMQTNRAVKSLILNSPAAKRGEHSTRTQSIEALTRRISELRFQLDLMQQSQQPDKTDRIQSIELEIAQTSGQLERLNEEEVQAYLKNPLPASDIRKRVADLEIEYQTDWIRAKRMEQEVNDVMAKEKKFQPQKLEFDRLQTELAHRRKMLNNLFVKEQETELELSAGSAEVFRLQEPTRNPKHIAPLIGNYVYGSLSICIFVLIGTMVVFITFFPRLDSENEVNRLNLPVLGKIPVIRAVDGRVDDLPSATFEYLKIMNYRILRETKEVRCPVIVITSPYAREGKSTVTQLLSLASQGPNRRALLIDGDLLTSHPNRFFGINQNASPGLKSVLEGDPNINTASLIVETAHEGIHFLPRGDRIEPSVLPSFLEPIRKLLDQWRKEYDIVFIDTPPLFAANLAHQWIGIADLIVLVARIYVTRPKDVIEGLQTCKVFSKAPVGTALNCVSTSGPKRRSSNYYYFTKRKNRPMQLAA